MNYFFEPYTFEKYAALETQNPKLKQYLDLNRFSAVIKCKLNGDSATANTLYHQIDVKNLSKKKAFLLQLPSFALQLLVKFKNLLAKIGLGNSVFR